MANFHCFPTKSCDLVKLMEGALGAHELSRSCRDEGEEEQGRDQLEQAAGQVPGDRQHLLGPRPGVAAAQVPLVMRGPPGGPA